MVQTIKQVIASFIEFDPTYLPSLLLKFFAEVESVTMYLRLDTWLIPSIGSMLKSDWGKSSI